MLRPEGDIPRKPNDFRWLRDISAAITYYVYLALYVFLCVWTALYHPEHLSTAITVTGGIVSVVFAGYVLTKTYEKVKNGNGNGNHKPPGGDENGASD
ncbi:MAG: hypothetical protein NTX59_10165 [Elusimicrobia bacterium]|nr:hypothetical protein [Elusimicrobiota bacterium]